MANQKYLQFDPVVIVWENTGEQTPGVRITLGDPSIFADISADKFFALLYTISSFNMYMSAQLLLNYIGRPNYGFNMMEIERNTLISPFVIFKDELLQFDIKKVNLHQNTERENPFPSLELYRDNLLLDISIGESISIRIKNKHRKILIKYKKIIT